MSDLFGDGFFESIERHHKEMREGFAKLLQDPCSRVPVAGDRVVFAGGLIGHGHPWVRIEAVVVEAAQQSFKLQWPSPYSKDGEVNTEWVHFALITDVLGEPNP